jgi:hypothetical protein
LDIPFRQVETEATRMQRFPGSVEWRGETIVATIELLDNWVRLAYGALAYRGFQAEPARLSVAFTYKANVPLSEDAGVIVIGDSVSWTPVYDPPIFIKPHLEPPIIFEPLPDPPDVASVQVRPEALVEGPVFVASTASLVVNSGAIQFAHEPLLNESLLVAHRFKQTKKPAAFEGVPLQHVVAAARPNILINPDLLADLFPRPQVKYATETIAHEEFATALFPCEELGGLYLEETADDGTAAIGCQDAFRLGEIAYRQFKEITELRDPLYQVFQSLTQPGRFLLLPAAFRIGRFPPDNSGGQAYRPAAMVFAVVSTDPNDNRYFFRATLQPDVPPFALHLLESLLGPYTPFGHTPQIDLPTDPGSGATATSRWSLPSEISAPETLVLWDGFQVSLSTPFVNALLLTTMLETQGVEGQATFDFPDGTKATSRLVLDGAICGPWRHGPIATTIAQGRVTLVNRIERDVDVSDLLVRDAAGAERRLPVERAIAPGEASALDAPGATVAWPVYAVEPGPLSLVQQNVYVEDVTANVILVNLVRYANHQLAELAAEVRLRGADAGQTVTLVEQATAEIGLSFPLTDYLAAPTIQFRITKRFTDGTPEGTTAWQEWNLATQGNVISITWELIG